jgi:hypothetical protein
MVYGQPKWRAGIETRRRKLAICGRIGTQ